ncbi:uncharacterized protein LOC117107465 [Anneissia japonica]|uniref:uncharacterized protein LOC117107465 n=1 Tax=Anneissia japonica TaxID=1529436 RepID=UPI0014256D40|nr:uncharacterized protein LOC117107465 [Anneissia japonica]
MTLVMQYTKEVAVLEAAFQLARKHIPNVVRSSITSLGDASPGDASLGDFCQDDTRKEVADTLVTALNEIVAGLEYPSSQAEKEHVSFAMHSILFDCFSKDVSCMINRSRNNTCHNPLDVFPRIGCRLYYIILIRMNWGHLFGQMVSPLPVDQSKLILRILLHLIIVEPQEKVEDFVAEIISGMLPDAPTSTHSIVDLVLTGQQAQRIVHPDKFRNLLVFFDILFGIIMKELDDSKRKDGIEDSDDSKGIDGVLYRIVSSCISRLIIFLESLMRQDLGMIEEQPPSKQLFTVEPLFKQHGIGQPHTKKPHTIQPHAVKPCANIPIQFYQKLQQLLTSDELENTFNFGSMADNTTDDSIGDLHVFMDDLLCCVNSCIGACRQQVPDALKPFNPADEINQGEAMFLEKCYQLLTIWKTFCNEPEEIERKCSHLAMLETEFQKHFQVEEKEERLDGISKHTHTVEDALRTAVWRVDNRLLGYQESLMWIMKNLSCNTNDLWISCLERNVTGFGNLKLLQCLVDCTIQQQLLIGERTLSTIVERLLLVLLKSFEMVSIGIQNRVRDYFTEEQHKHLAFYLYEEYTALKLPQQVIVAFNRLVNSSNANNVQDLLQYVSPIAFQSPRQTIQKALTESVNNAGVIPLVSQVLDK